jgi:hypothetical protein
MAKACYAILLDGGFVTKKLYAVNKRYATVDDVVTLCDKLRKLTEVQEYELLRIYFYDAFPSAEETRWPISNTPYNLGKTARFRHSQSLFDQLVLKPNFALRMGEARLNPSHWKLNERAIADLKRGRESSSTKIFH